MADEYIRRKDTIRAFEADNQHLYYPFEVTNRLRTVPTADAVPVVRCKDCRYCWKMRRLTPYKEDEWTMWCMWYMSASYALLTTPEDYCSHGRKNDG